MICPASTRMVAGRSALRRRPHRFSECLRAAVDADTNWAAPAGKAELDLKALRHEADVHPLVRVEPRME